MGWRRKRESEKMGRAPCCDKVGLKKGPWTPEEDNILVDYINKNGHGSWRSLPQNAGLSRCGKSCRLRWTNYLRPDIKRGPFTPEEERTIIHLHAIVGNRWSTIAGQMPGRTDNEIKNFWNTHLKKRLQVAGVDPLTFSDLTPTTSSSARHMAQWESARLEAEARLSRESLLLSSSTSQPQALDLTATAAAATDTDHFLRMWHSEVGESFRRFCPRSSNGQDGSTCQPAKHTASPAASSSSTAAAAAATATASTITSEQCGSGSVGHNEMEKKGVKAVVVKREESRTSSNEMEAEEEEDDNNDSQETSLSLLLDFPASDEMDFFQGHLSLSF